MTVKNIAFDEMEKELLPVFAEAVKLCKEISDNPDYFLKPNNYCAARRLYAMAIVSKAIKLVNKDVTDEEHQKKNISRLDLLNDRHFYQPNGSIGSATNIFKHPEIVDFKNKMRALGASYYDDTIIHECLGSFQYDAAVNMWEGNPVLISPNGDILDWKNAKNLGIFKYATENMKSAKFTTMMNKQSKENKWDKKEWNRNYPLVNRECEKQFELKISQYCEKKQNLQYMMTTMKQHIIK